MVGPDRSQLVGIQNPPCRPRDRTAIESPFATSKRPPAASPQASRVTENLVTG